MWTIWLLLVGSLHLVAGHRQNRPAGIFGGYSVDHVPYMASLWFEETGDFACGATIIHERFILTAAQCIDKNIEYFVVVGSSRLNEIGDKYTVDKMIQHPHYSNVTLEYDAALLRVSIPIIFSKNVQIVTLPYTKEYLTLKTPLTTYGWGETESGDLSNILRTADLLFLPRKMCQTFYDDSITEKMICAAGFKEDTCWGDSGGPLINRKSIDDWTEDIQVGITSSGNDPCGTFTPSVYTRVYSITPWISKTIIKLS